MEISVLKKIIGWPIAEGLHFIGDKVSIVMEWIDREWAFDVLYPVYNWCMRMSLHANDWAGLDLWVKRTYQCPKCGVDYYEELDECDWCPGVKPNGTDK